MKNTRSLDFPKNSCKIHVLCIKIYLSHFMAKNDALNYLAECSLCTLGGFAPSILPSGPSNACSLAWDPHTDQSPPLHPVIQIPFHQHPALWAALVHPDLLPTPRQSPQVATRGNFPLAIFFSFIKHWVRTWVIGPFWRRIDNLSFLELLPSWPAKWTSVKRRKWGSGQGRESSR